MNDSPCFDQAHPRAQRIMVEEFYYSPTAESGPFGSDDALDTFADFAQWRPDHPADDPLAFLEEHFGSWGYPPFDLHTEEPEKILDYCHAHELGSTFLSGMDAAIVATAFGQLYLEGRIDTPLQALAITALNRQLSFYLLQLWDEPYRPTRQEQLAKLLRSLHQV
jgi:uncharacterized protein YfeS